MRKAVILSFVIVVLGLGAATSNTHAAGFDLGQAGGYAALILPGGTINMDINGGAAVVGDVAISANSHLDLGSDAKVGPMAGTGQVVDGNIFLDPNGATIKLQNQDPNSVSQRNLAQAVSDAFAANSAAASLAPTQTFTNLDITTPFSIVGNGGVNVISLNSINLHSNGLLTLVGVPSDVFIFNISGTYTQSGEANVLLSAGVSQGNVLWNFIGSGNAPNIAGPGDTQTVGTFLAPNRAFSITDVTLHGSIIATGDLKVGSQALIIVPEISTAHALILGFALLAGTLWLRHKRLVSF
jgi:choice-of-anchor A domain-containing protein